MPFAPLLRMARAWLGAPESRTPAQLEALVSGGREASPAVPEERRADWEKLLVGLSQDNADEDAKTVARVEGYVRACTLFKKKQRAAAAREARAARPPKPKPLATPFDTVDRLPGFGPTARIALAEHGLRTVTDLVWLSPAAWDDLREPMPLASAVEAARGTYEATGGALRPVRVVVSAIVKSSGVVPIRGRRAVRVVLQDENDTKCTLHAFWFFMAHGVLASAKPGAKVIVVGRIKAEPRKPARMAHPELFADVPETRIVRARYPRLGPPEVTMRKAILHALASGVAPDPVPPRVAARETMPDVATVLLEIHAATCLPASDAARRGFVERLAWTEAFTRAWERIAADERQGTGGAPVLPRRADLVRALERELGFTFTKGQREAIEVVSKDLEEPRPMRRLLLGDVGTGKTAVALAAAAQCVAAGFQVAILAPTSVLAEQYVDAVRPLERALGLRVAFVAAGTPAAARRSAEEAIRSGAAQVAVGTHALLGEGVSIPKLGLVIVDEQQRLGVAQRLALVRKGERPHLLTLSATPIPRTLALALRGELATSTLRERPAGRPPVATELAGASKIESVIARVEQACARGERVFWIVPRIEADPDDEEDDDPLATAVERRELLAVALSDTKRNVMLLHGGMSAVDKRETMQAFRRGAADVLVGTTVVEVGVDVPEATLIVVEDAQRFGLAQLHQLRGRVGRGARPGECILLHGEPLEGFAKARLTALTELSTGEEVARADLELRGAGDLGGTRQHGAEDELLYLTAGITYPWLERIEADARAIAKTDPTLAAEEHRVLGSLVARFGHAIAVREEAG
ncbi:MAG: ATP-dependent helicase RecG [Myxococcaceae bacterium]|nr:ATP-dependent helicase RecG [Myxococcaceae bacterium]